ncbi:MAG: corrinoid protein, partial [Anaerolineae bacterium]|nr:corrinoid protein [Anaerolineae bacterium]
MQSELLARITASVVEGDPEGSQALARQALAEGLAPLAIVEQGLVPGMTAVGERFASGEYFLPQLVIAARCMELAMEVLQPELLRRQEAVARAGTVVIGTVKGDIHEIGKNLVATMLAASGFQVIDLGVNVPTEVFVGKVQEVNADLLGLSALLTTTMTEQREVIGALERAGLRGRVKVIIGGAPVSQRWADSIGADGYAEDAVGAVALAR